MFVLFWYCGLDKTARFSLADLRLQRLKRLAPVGPMPDIRHIEQAMSRTWVDHVHEWAGTFLHPSEHVPNYGRDMGQITAQAALLVYVDFDQLPGKPRKERILVNLVQYGIDLVGIDYADRVMARIDEDTADDFDVVMHRWTKRRGFRSRPLNRRNGSCLHLVRKAFREGES